MATTIRIYAGTFALILAGFAGSLSAASVLLDSLLPDPPSNTANRFTVVATTSIGNDSETTDVGGMALGTLGYRLNGSELTPTDFTFTDGTITLTDMNFRFLFGIVTVQTRNMRGTPSTLNPPAPITGMTFPGDRHQVTFNQGTVVGGGQTLDFSNTPVTAVGQGNGTFTVAQATPLNNHMIFYNVSLRLPVAFDEPFSFDNVPVVGTVSGTLAGSGAILLRDNFSLTLTPGDYDGDGGLNCADIDLLQIAIRNNSVDLAFDVNADGLVRIDDYLAWVTDLKHTLPGDADLDRVVDGVDLGIWNAHKFTAGAGWCAGDFDGDSTVDGSDLNIWNANKFTQASRGVLVPEPIYGIFSWIGLLVAARRIQ